MACPTRTFKALLYRNLMPLYKVSQGWGRRLVGLLEEAAGEACRTNRELSDRLTRRLLARRLLNVPLGVSQLTVDAL
jgi:hypothetical protein